MLPGNRKCPKCPDTGETMHRDTFAGIEIDRCGRCQGILLDRGELQPLLKRQGGAALDAPTTTRKAEAMDLELARCPECGSEMEHLLTSSGICMDICQSCGAVFLDQGELATLERGG